MKKVLLILLVSTFTLLTYAQSSQNENSYYKGIETYRDLQLSPEQIAKIKKLRREASSKFASIGKDRSLSGYEKGQRKKQLAMELRQEIERVLTQNQISGWESKHGKYSSLNDIRNNISDDYERRLDALEDEYDAKINAAKNNDSLSKNERKAQIEALKQKYKAEKNRLKAEKERAKNEIR